MVDRRDLDAVVRIRSGETLVLAGIIQTREPADNQGVPWLRNIPLLGALFSNTQDPGAAPSWRSSSRPRSWRTPPRSAAERKAEQRLDSSGAN